jgi:hypothetical protein
MNKNKNKNILFRAKKKPFLEAFLKNKSVTFGKLLIFTENMWKTKKYKQKTYLFWLDGLEYLEGSLDLAPR